MSIKDVYPALLAAMKRDDLPEAGPLSGSLGVGWGLSGGEAAGLSGITVLAADGIENIIRVLEDLEDEKITDVDFVELSACAGGCVGGILTVENPFLARTRLQKIQGHLSPEAQPPEVTDERLMLFDHPIKFCEVLSLARDLTTAMELLAGWMKLNKISMVWTAAPAERLPAGHLPPISLWDGQRWKTAFTYSGNAIPQNPEYSKEGVNQDDGITTGPAAGLYPAGGSGRGPGDPEDLLL